MTAGPGSCRSTGARLVITAEGLDTAHGDQELNFGLRALLAREQLKQYVRRSDDFKRRKTEAGVAVGASQAAAH